MHAAVKPLQWLDSFAASIAGALGTSVTHQWKDGREPLVKIVSIQFGEQLSGESFMLVWNLLQFWAAKNNCVPQGKVERDGRKMIVKMALKNRIGLTKVLHPLGDKK